MERAARLRVWLIVDAIVETIVAIVAFILADVLDQISAQPGPWPSLLNVLGVALLVLGVGLAILAWRPARRVVLVVAIGNCVTAGLIALALLAWGRDLGTDAMLAALTLPLVLAPLAWLQWRDRPQGPSGVHDDH